MPSTLQTNQQAAQVEEIEGEEAEEEMEEEMEIEVAHEGLLYGQLPELCLLAEERGNCFGEMLRFRFDPDADDCVGFFYTGCGQNANNFLSYEQCARACGPWKSQAICELPEANGTGECGGGVKGAAVPKWYFDASTGRCAMFFWAGCGGNGNQFQSKSECENLCRREIQVRRDQPLCEMPMDAGPCDDFVTLWYFDRGQKQCRKFTFGGCRGNANRFVTEHECQAQCHHRHGEVNNQHRHQIDEGASQNAAQNAVQNAAKNHRPSPPPPIAVRPRLFAFPIGTLLAGTTNLTLRCAVGHGGAVGEGEEHIFSWYRNNRLVGPIDGKHHFESTSNNAGGGGAIVGQLRVIGAAVEDGGWYACSYGQSLISEPVNVKIMQPDTTQQASACAGDRGIAEVCRNVLKFGLCPTLRYGQYCCSTCRRQNDV